MLPESSVLCKAAAIPSAVREGSPVQHALTLCSHDCKEEQAASHQAP